MEFNVVRERVVKGAEFWARSLRPSEVESGAMFRTPGNLKMDSLGSLN
jgi:hypothetical protein